MTEPQLGPEGALGAEDGGTLNAIGRALIQMQQGAGGQSITAGSSPGIPQSQLIFTRAASTDSDTVASSGTNNGERSFCYYCSCYSGFFFKRAFFSEL